MMQHTKFLGKSMFLLIPFLCHAAQAASVSVLAPIVEVKGSASWARGGTAKPLTLRSGESLAEGSVITTGANSRVVFSPVPGAAVSGAKGTSVALSRLAVTKSRDAVQSRDAVLKLDSGTLSFSLVKRNASTTSFAVQTRFGTMNARGSAGTIAVAGSSLHLASLNGKMTFTATGSQVAISIEPGSFLVVSGEGTRAQIRVINTIARTSTAFSADGTKLATREATVQELESARGLFEATLAHVAVAVGYGLLSNESVAEITVTLTKINQAFATAGLAPVDAQAVETSTPGASPSPGITVAPAANPANTSGLIISPAR